MRSPMTQVAIDQESENLDAYATAKRERVILC